LITTPRFDFLKSATSSYKLVSMEAVLTQEFEFLKDLPQNESSWPAGLKEEIAEYTSAFQEHDGLILRAVAPDLLQVSRQRFDQISKKYDFWSGEFFEKTWYSRKELENFSKIDRPVGKHGKTKAAPSVLSIASKIKNDLVE